MKSELGAGIGKGDILFEWKKRLERFNAFCRANRKTVAMMVLAAIMVTGLQAVKIFVDDGVCITAGGGRVTAVRRDEPDKALSVPLHIKASRGDADFEDEIILTLKGSKALTSQKSRASRENPAAQLERQIKSMISQVETADGDVIPLPEKLEDGTIVRWEKQGHSQIFAGLLFLPLSLILLYRSRQEKTEKERRERMMSVKRSLPGFNNQLLLLLNSGLIFSDAFERITDGYAGREQPGSFCKMLLDIRRRSEKTGSSTITLLNEYSRSVGIKEFSRLVNIISDNQYKGVNLTEKLEEESDLLWEQRKKLAEEKGKATETKLSFPLAILLLVLILVTAAPAILQI